MQIGTLITIREVIRNIFEIPSGIIADALGRRRTMIASFTMYIASFVVFYLAGAYGLLAVAMVFFAIGDAFRTGTHKAMIFTWLEVNGWTGYKVEYYGHTRSWSQRGSALSSLLAAAVVFWSGHYRMAFLISVIPYMFDLILMISYPAVLEGPGWQKSSSKLSHAIGEVFRQLFLSLRQLGNIRLLMNTSLYSGLFRTVKDYFQPVLAALAAVLAGKLSGMDEAGVTALLVGVIYFFLYLGTAAVSARSGGFSRRFPSLYGVLNATLITGLLIVFAAGAIWLVPYPWRWIVIIPFVLIYLLENVRRPVAVACIAESLPGDILATTLSVESQTRSLVAAVLAPLLGFIVDKSGIGGGLIAVASFLIILFPLVRMHPAKE
ncbi:MAG: MFS transporter [Chlorobi bacterium]|nr:MFS transporter [Chlorobiota bacterium]